MEGGKISIVNHAPATMEHQQPAAATQRRRRPQAHTCTHLQQEGAALHAQVRQHGAAQVPLDGLVVAATDRNGMRRTKERGSQGRGGAIIVAERERGTEWRADARQAAESGGQREHAPHDGLQQRQRGMRQGHVSWIRGMLPRPRPTNAASTTAQPQPQSLADYCRTHRVYSCSDQLCGAFCVHMV